MIARTKKEETLSDKIAGLLSTAPESFDPEDDIYEETRAQVNNKQLQDSDTEELYSSNFRKQNVDLLEDVDKRYVGKKGNRKSLKDSDDDWETEDEGLSTDEGEALDGVSGTQKILSSGENSDNDDDEVNGSDDNGEDESNIEFSDEDNLQDSKETTKNFKHMSDVNISKQLKKGTCVRNQLNIWESLLEIRIQLQKCLITSNKMPQYDIVRNFSEENFKVEAAKTKRTVRHILDKFLTLQELLLKQFPETKSLFKETKNKKEESDEEIPSDTDEEIKSDVEDESNEETPRKRKKVSDFEQEIKTRHEKYKDFRNSVIQKWNEKTRLAVPKNNSGSNSLVQHINFLLEDKKKLVRRTQLKRSDYAILGKIKPEIKTDQEKEQGHESKLPDEYDTEIFDDDDFYHQLLRELIEFKSAGITDPVQMSRQWIQLQNMRSKMKRKIDTRATKGRKIRYAIHSKLVNFMAPIDINSLTEEAKNELFSSLFGKNQPKNI